jgi:hypothetical protein
MLYNQIQIQKKARGRFRHGNTSEQGSAGRFNAVIEAKRTSWTQSALASRLVIARNRS